MANICAGTVLAVLTEAEDRHWGVGLMGREYDPPAVTTCLRAAKLNAGFLFEAQCLPMSVALIL